MNQLVNVTIAVDPAAAEALTHPANLLAAGQMVSQAFRAKIDVQALAEAICDAKAEARANGLTDDEIDAELEAYNAERRTRP